MLEVLHSAFVLLCGFARLKRAQISALSGFSVSFSGIESILAGLHFPDHRNSSLEKFLMPLHAISIPGTKSYPKRWLWLLSRGLKRAHSMRDDVMMSGVIE